MKHYELNICWHHSVEERENGHVVARDAWKFECRKKTVDSSSARRAPSEKGRTQRQKELVSSEKQLAQKMQ